MYSIADDHSQDLPETRWLDGQEMDAWRQLVGFMSWLPSALDAQLLRDAGLTHFEYQVMSALSETPDHTMRMSALTGLANGTLSRLSHVVQRLEKRGWVLRETCASDGRFTNAILTEAGYAKVVESAPGYAENVRNLVIAPLTRAQLKQLAAIGQRINDARPGANP